MGLKGQGDMGMGLKATEDIETEHGKALELQMSKIIEKYPYFLQILG